MHGFGVISNIPFKEKNEETPDLAIANIDVNAGLKNLYNFDIKSINIFAKKTDTLELEDEPVKKKTKDIYGEWVTYLSN